MDAASLLRYVAFVSLSIHSGKWLLGLCVCVTAVVACRARVGREKVKCQAWSSDGRAHMCTST